VEPVSNEAFHYLNPDCPRPPLFLSLPLYVYSHLHCTWQQPVVFAREEKNKTALVKISLKQNSLSLKTPERGGGMEAAGAFFLSLFLSLSLSTSLYLCGEAV